MANHDRFSPTFADHVQPYELDQVEERRRRVHSPQTANGEPEVSAQDWKMPKGEDERLRADLVGLAFSGGGIRSGTFNLGILQALGRLKLLTRLDYLSTVSGGGYIGGWLAAWIKRAKEDVPVGLGRPTWTAVEAVQGRLDPRTNRLESGPTCGVTEPEPETIHHLRAHSRYLAPRYGLFSLDTWTLVAIYLRGLFINLLLVVPAVIAVALLCRLVVVYFAWPYPGNTVSWVWFGVGLLILLGALILLREQLDQLNQEPRSPTDPDPGEPPNRKWQRLLLRAVLFSVALIGVWLIGPASGGPEAPGHARSRMPVQFPASSSLTSEILKDAGLGLVLGLFGGAVTAVYFLRATGRDRRGGGAGEGDGVTAASRGGTGRVKWVALMTVLFVVVFCVLFAVVVSRVLFFNGGNYPALFATFGPPLVLAALLAAGFLETAIAGGLYSEYEREWRSRIAGSVLKLGVLWVLVFGSVIYVPWLVLEVEALLTRNSAITKDVIPWGAVAGWVVTTVGGLFVARRVERSAGRPNIGRIARVVPIVFLVGLLAIGSALSLRLTGPECGLADHAEYHHQLQGSAGGLPDAADCYFRRLEDAELGPVFWWLVFFAVLTGALVLLLPATRFSLHSLYMNRLVRCYLGASLADAKREHRGQAALDTTRPRRANPFTGFDPSDDLPLAALRIDPSELPADWPEPYLGPYPIFNTTLNLVAGKELAYQDRKGSSFILTPGYCGSRETGYAMLGASGTDARDGLTVGRAVAISGAAIDPNMGVYQSPQLTAFLTILNARLGWWLENPRVDRARAEAEAALWKLIGCQATEVPDAISAADVALQPFLGEQEAWDRIPTTDPARGRRDKLKGEWETTVEAADPLIANAALWVIDDGVPSVVTPEGRDELATYHLPLIIAPVLRRRLPRLLGLPDNFSSSLVVAQVRRTIPLDGAMESVRTSARRTLTTLATFPREWTAGPPRMGAWWYCRELFGETDDVGQFVHLSDGGHFENTGAYELVRRRCRHVIVIDAAEDPADASENLANLIRLVRTDFGIPIDIDTSPVRKDANGISRWHCAVGAIRYDEVDPSGVTGTLLFIRPSLTGDEEADLKNYAATNPPFPHHSTADQFFDEAQFESYRQLGFHIGMEVFGRAQSAQEVGEPPEPTSDAEYRAYTRLLFAALRRAWAPLPDEFASGYLQSCRDYLKTAEDLRDGEPPTDRPDRGLRRVSRSLFADARNLPFPARRARFATSQPPGVDTDAYYTDLHEVDYLLQVMEIAWLENDLDRFAAHSSHRGWMNVFRRWTASGAFHRYWPVLRGQYGREFVRFCSVALNLAELPVQWCRITAADEDPWREILSTLGVEFQREWAESLLALEDLGPAEQRNYLTAAVAASRVGAAPLAWVVTTGRGGERTGAISADAWEAVPDETGGVNQPSPPEYSPPHAAGQRPRAYIPMGLVVAFPSGTATAALRRTAAQRRLAEARRALAYLAAGRLAASAAGWTTTEVDDELRAAGGELAAAEAGLRAADKGVEDCARAAREKSEYELLVWIRGPYRSLGLGRVCLPWLLDNESGDPDKRGIAQVLPNPKGAKLVVRYPQLTGTAGDRLQRRVWTWFFNDHDFVGEGSDPREPDPPEVRLVRHLAKPSAALTAALTARRPGSGRGADVAPPAPTPPDAAAPAVSGGTP